MAKVQSLALVGGLAGGIAHEIRNPIGSISGSIQFLTLCEAKKAQSADF